MKRIIILLFLCALCSSCARMDFLLEEKFRTTEKLKAYDMQERFAGGYSISESDGALYFSHYGQSNGYIWYYDLETSQSGKLCAKPECTHDSAQCNAYSVVAGNVNVYDGKLYWVGSCFGQAEACLQRLSLDGSDREVLRTYPDAGGVGTTFRLHRGYLYCGRVINEVHDGQSSARIILTQEKIEGPGDNEPIVVYEKSVSGLSTPQFQYVLSGNTLYLAVSGEEQPGSFSSAFYRYDIAARSLQCVEERKASEYVFVDMQLDSKGIYLIERALPAGKYDLLVRRYDPDTQTLEIYDEQPQFQPRMYHKVNGYKLIYAKGFQTLPEYTLQKEDGSAVRQGTIHPPTKDFRSCDIEFWGWTDDFMIFDMEYYQVYEDGGVKGGFELIAVPFDPSAAETTFWHYDYEFANPA